MKHIKFSYILIACLALSQGILWLNVFSLFHHGILVYLGGIPAGLGIVGIITRSANLLPRVPSKRARNAGWAFLIILILIEPFVLGFANWPVVMNTSITITGSYVVAGGTSLVVTLALVLGAIVDRSLIPVEKQPKEEKSLIGISESKINSRKEEKKVSRKPVKDSEISTYFLGNPDATNTEAAEAFGITPQAIGQRRKKLQTTMNLGKETKKEIVWSCPSCSTINNSDRKECRQCGAQRINENGSEKEKITSLK